MKQDEEDVLRVFDPKIGAFVAYNRDAETQLRRLASPGSRRSARRPRRRRATGGGSRRRYWSRRNSGSGAGLCSYVRVPFFVLFIAERPFYTARQSTE